MEGVWVGLVMRVTAADTKIILEIPCTKQKTTIIIIIIITILYQAHCSYFGWGGGRRDVTLNAFPLQSNQGKEKVKMISFF